MKHKRDDGAEKQDEETVDVTPIMICVFVVMCCNMLVLLYFFYDRLGTCNIQTEFRESMQRDSVALPLPGKCMFPSSC